MDVDQMRSLEPKLVKFLDHFHDCFGRKDTRAHLGVYVRGQLSDLPQKSVEPIALDAGVAPRTLQEFLSQLRWREDRVLDQLQQLVATEHQGPHTVGILDETLSSGASKPAIHGRFKTGHDVMRNDSLNETLQRLSTGSTHQMSVGFLFLLSAGNRERLAGSRGRQ